MQTTGSPKAVAAKLDPVMKYMVLVTTLSHQIQGVRAFHVLIHADIERLTNRQWKDPRLSYGENKFRMKMLGGIVFSYRRFAAELSLLALAKALEDMLVEASDLGCRKFSIWKGDELRLRYHHEMRYIRALANTVKHSQSRIIDNASKNNRFLIDECGVRPGNEVEHLRIDVPRHVYRVYWFLMQLAAHLAGVEADVVPKREGNGFRRFERLMLPAFLNMRAASGR
jgi:hypothetical protein